MKERCPKCNGFIFHEIVREGGAIIAYWKCINCGMRIYKKTPYTEPEPGKYRMKCKLCGKIMVVQSRNREYCDSCRLILNRKRSAKKRIRTCVICGKNFLGSRSAKYCPDCRGRIYSNARMKYKVKPKEAKHALSVS